VELAGVDHDLDPLSLACVRATNGVLCSEASSSSLLSISAPVSEASSRVSSVTTGSAASVKWTNASEPTVSRSSATAVKRRESGASRAIAASSVASGRMPSTSERPS
jgi:hypothetical protein